MVGISGFRMQFFWWVALLVVFCALDSSLGQSELDYLLEFKKGIEKDPFGHLDSWKKDSVDSNGCPSNWFGIECQNGSVTKITLPGAGLVGTVNFSMISKLKTLGNFSLPNNLLRGGLTPDIGSMASLEYLDLSGNFLDGKVPSSLSNLQSLAYLNLSSNNLSGNLPSGFEKLHRLTYIDLHANNLEGDIGSWFSQLQNVVLVDLSFNKFSGSFPKNINNLTFIRSIGHMNMSHNLLSGSLFTPNVKPLFDNLQVFDASFNQLSGDILAFSSMFALQVLRLQGNLFSGDLPVVLFKENSMVLSELDLSLNRFQGPVSSITSSTLKVLNLSSNELAGTLPKSIGNCAVVDLSNNKLSGNITGIQSWGNYVEFVDLSSNSLSGTLPNQTSKFLRLTTIKLSNNSLEGELPNVMETYPKLNHVDLSHNKLTGHLLTGIFTSSTLTYVNLSGNHFTGSITFLSSQAYISAPSDTPLLPSQNSSLDVLDLSNNLLSGLLPPDIGSLVNLQVLDLNKNDFSGPIPSEISMLKNLVYLDLSNNHLNGSIPDGFSPRLQEFNVSYNNLSGNVPDNLLKFPDSSFHPGNPLLILLSPSPKDGPDHDDKGKHQNHLKRVVLEALIAGSIGGAIVILILFLLITYKPRPYRRDDQQNSNNKISGRDVNIDRSSRPHAFGFQKNAEAMPTSSSFSTDHLLSSEGRSLSALGDVALAVSEPVEQGFSQSTKGPVQTAKSCAGESLPPRSSKRTSLGFSCSPSADASSLSENPASLKVPSPDRLAGDLHFFDTSFVFSAEELSRAPAEVLGRSSHGTSYKATLDNGHMLTVKWLREGLAKRRKEFAREAKKLGSIRHPNIVSLRGYYWGPKEHEKLIVSDYISAHTLAHYLFEPESRKLPPLSANQRLKVAIDVACCLNYLHNEGGLPHGNLKATNILLEPPSLNAVLTDYSLHRLMSPAGTAEQILNAGALGYRAPELALAEKPLPSLKADVYAFGVILMEILTGKCAGEIISANSGVVDLTDWVKLLATEDRRSECFDQLIPGVESPGEHRRGLETMLEVSLRCILPASERPNIRMVFDDLNSVVL
ncbi:probable inactive receptor kinase At5g10020 [Nymphaea colorata]|nr:probable inactive receptor kinase At5g10020 [Nymphaea colorata]